MATNKVDPFMAPIPTKIKNDPELAPFFTYLAKWCHDMWVRTGAGVDLIDLAASTTDDNTFSGATVFSQDINLDGAAVKISSTQVVGSQQAAVADVSAATASSQSYTPHASGAVTVTSNAATDLDTTAAALDSLVDEFNLALADIADMRTKLNSLLAKLRTHGLIAT